MPFRLCVSKLRTLCTGWVGVLMFGLIAWNAVGRAGLLFALPLGLYYFLFISSCWWEGRVVLKACMHSRWKGHGYWSRAATRNTTCPHACSQAPARRRFPAQLQIVIESLADNCLRPSLKFPCSSKRHTSPCLSNESFRRWRSCRVHRNRTRTRWSLAS